MKLRTVLTAGAGLLVLAAAAWNPLRPGPLPVEVGKVGRGALRVSVEGPGKARVLDRFVVTAPVPGHLARGTARAGDAVEAGSVVAVVRPVTPAPLDDRTRRARARLAAARAAEAEARAARIGPATWPPRRGGSGSAPARWPPPGR